MSEQSKKILQTQVNSTLVFMRRLESLANQYGGIAAVIPSVTELPVSAASTLSVEHFFSIITKKFDHVTVEKFGHFFPQALAENMKQWIHPDCLGFNTQSCHPQYPHAKTKLGKEVIDEDHELFSLISGLPRKKDRRKSDHSNFSAEERAFVLNFVASMRHAPQNRIRSYSKAKPGSVPYRVWQHNSVGGSMKAEYMEKKTTSSLLLLLLLLYLL